MELKVSKEHRTKSQVSVNLNMVETRDSVAETQRQTRVSVSGYIRVSQVNDKTRDPKQTDMSPEHYF